MELRSPKNSWRGKQFPLKGGQQPHSGCEGDVSLAVRLPPKPRAHESPNTHEFGLEPGRDSGSAESRNYLTPSPLIGERVAEGQVRGARLEDKALVNFGHQRTLEYERTVL